MCWNILQEERERRYWVCVEDFERRRRFIAGKSWKCCQGFSKSHHHVRLWCVLHELIKKILYIYFFRLNFWLRHCHLTFGALTFYRHDRGVLFSNIHDSSWSDEGGPPPPPEPAVVRSRENIVEKPRRRLRRETGPTRGAKTNCWRRGKLRRRENIDEGPTHDAPLLGPEPVIGL